jgi:primosomal protein N'
MIEVGTAIRILALKEVLSDTPSSDYEIRKIFRWYSKEFCTPLHMVDELPMYDVIRHYWEYQYESADEDTQLKEADELSKSPEELAKEKARIARRLKEEEDFAKEAEAENQESQIEEKIVLAKEAEKLAKQIEETFVTMEELEAMADKSFFDL